MTSCCVWSRTIRAARWYYSLHLACCSGTECRACRVATYASRHQGGTPFLASLADRIVAGGRSFPLEKYSLLPLSGGCCVSPYFPCQSLCGHPDMQSASALITGQQAVMLSQTTSLAQPFPCWPLWTSLPIEEVLVAEMAEEGYLGFIVAAPQLVTLPLTQFNKTVNCRASFWLANTEGCCI